MLGYFEMLSPKPPPRCLVWGVKNVSLFSAVHYISRNVEMLNPKTPNHRLGWSGGSKHFCIDFLGSLCCFRTFELLTPGVGWVNFF